MNDVVVLRMNAVDEVKLGEADEVTRSKASLLRVRE